MMDVKAVSNSISKGEIITVKAVSNTKEEVEEYAYNHRENS